MIFNHSDYRSYLREVYTNQLAKNPSYSLRAFARKLGMAPSSLSEILSGKKRISHEMALKIAGQLNLKEKETRYFSLLADIESAGSESLREDLTKQIQKLNRHRAVATLDVEIFRAVSEWYHIALMEMTRLPHLDFEPRKLARQLGITAVEVNAAIQRLEKLELIEKDAKGRYRKVQDNVLFSTPGKNEALRKYHQQMLMQASKALEKQEPSERFVGSETFIFDEKLLGDANAILEECFEKMVELATRSKNPKHVFHLGIQLFSLTKNGEKP